MITLLQRVQSLVLNRNVPFFKTLSEAKLNLVMMCWSLRTRWLSAELKELKEREYDRSHVSQPPQKLGGADCNLGDTLHFESCNLPTDFRSRTSHDAVPQTLLPNTLLLWTLVPILQRSFIMEKPMPLSHYKFVFLPLLSMFLPSFRFAQIKTVLHLGSKSSEISQEQASLYSG